jgi:DNA polymerase-3 subunit epsilon
MHILTQPVLVLDFQTTGASPARGCLLEAAWAVVRDGDVPDAAPERCTACLVALPPGAAIPRRVSALTGIWPADLVDARARGQVWTSLLESAAPLPRTRSGRIPLVIHYARFEEPFLRELHTEFSPGEEFPFELYCTHEIARRLYPALPRRSLKALAGFLGHPLPELKRAGPHVEATALVWRELGQNLSRSHGIHSLDDLNRWLADTSPRRAARKEYPMSRSRRLGLPDAPGVYRLVNMRGQVLYVGKAKSLHHRVNSHFQKQTGLPERSLELLTQIRDVDITVTASALEAALLESDEIKRLAPPYNRALTPLKRRILFFTPDLSGMGPGPEQGRTGGPVTGGAVITALRGILALGPKGLRPDKCPAALLQVPSGREPSVACFNEGWTAFREKHGFDAGPPTLPDMRRLGEELWLTLGEASPAEEAENGEESVAPTEEVRLWDPLRVVAALEWIVRTGTHQLRLGEWLNRLVDCWLAWPAAAGSGNWRRLLFQRGRRVSAEDVDGCPESAPAGWDGRVESGEAFAFDLAAYDRLRVLSSEVKRLRGEGRAVRLGLTSAVLSGEALDDCLRRI